MGVSKLSLDQSLQGLPQPNIYQPILLTRTVCFRRFVLTTALDTHVTSYMKYRAEEFDSFQTGSRTNRVVAEVPRLPLINLHGKLWQHVAKYSKMWQTVRTQNKQHMAKDVGDLWPFWRNTFVLTPSGSRWGVGRTSVRRCGGPCMSGCSVFQTAAWTSIAARTVTTTTLVHISLCAYYYLFLCLLWVVRFLLFCSPGP